MIEGEEVYEFLKEDGSSRVTELFDTILPFLDVHSYTDEAFSAITSGIRGAFRGVAKAAKEEI